MAVNVHPLPPQAEGIPSPARFTYPFCYTPHPLCTCAADEVRAYIAGRPEWHEELQRGKMLGVLVVEKDATRGFLAAFSGTLGGKTRHAYFVPPVFDLMSPGCHFQEEEAAITDISHDIAGLEAAYSPSPLRVPMQHALDEFRKKMKESKAERDRLRRELSAEQLAEAMPRLIRESQYEKAELRRMRQRWEERIMADEAPRRQALTEAARLRQERQQRSQALQQWLFRQFVFLNGNGEKAALPKLFSPDTPPAGAGECCAPRLLQAAFREGLRPVCMAEFWVGASPTDEVRTDGHYYPACNSKCRPILRHMLKGLPVEDNPLLADCAQLLTKLRILHEGDDFAVVSKPAGLLSVPGKDGLPSVQEAMQQHFPKATGPLIVHRLDMDTSGLMLIALTEERYHSLQRLFLERSICKVYHALLERPMPVGEEGDIRLPLRPDIHDRPRQMVDRLHGKSARTHYRVVGEKEGHALLELTPATGRTHQLRVHCAHPSGLNNPIVGDRLYGKPAERLMLHAYSLTVEGTTFCDAGSEAFAISD